jgi:hypothetical protein
MSSKQIRLRRDIAGREIHAALLRKQPPTAATQRHLARLTVELRQLYAAFDASTKKKRTLPSPCIYAEVPVVYEDTAALEEQQEQEQLEEQRRKREARREQIRQAKEMQERLRQAQERARQEREEEERRQRQDRERWQQEQRQLRTRRDEVELEELRTAAAREPLGAMWSRCDKWKEEPLIQLRCYLGLPASATPQQIKAAYRAMILKIHPDKSSEYPELFAKLNTVWQEYEQRNNM